MVLAFLIACCVFLVIIGLVWSEIMSVKHAIKVQALNHHKFVKSYEDMRSIVYKTEHALQDLKKIESHLVNRSVQMSQEMNSFTEEVGKIKGATSSIKFSTDQDRKAFKQFEEFVHSKFNKNNIV